MLAWYQHLPQIISPIAFTVGFLSVHWYSLMYLVGFAVVYGLLQWRVKKREYLNVISYQSSVIRKNTKNVEKNDDKFQVMDFRELLFDLLLAAFVGGLIGARLGYALIYNTSYFLLHPIKIISPYGLGGDFEGLYGMSYHGAMIGGIAGVYVYSKIKKLNFLNYADFIVPALSLGYFFGRLGNFLNGELFGRITTSKFGMYFAGSPNVLRYPSQILEALMEGLLLFIILWKLRNQKRMPTGFLFALYIFGYSAMRFICEFFRDPDVQLGYIFLGLTMGQVLSIVSVFILAGWLCLKNKKSAIIK